jgi:hypothetical protein
MKNLSKKHISYATNNLNNSKKFFSLIIVLLITTTAVSSIVSSQGILPNQVQNNLDQIQNDKPEIKIIRDSLLRERLSLIKEKIKSAAEKLAHIKNRSTDIITDEIDENNDYSSINIRSLKSPILRSFQKLLRLKLLNLTIMFYTNYSGIEKQVNIKFLQEKKIDVNNDDKFDIKVKLGLSFSIKRFLHFSINFKYLITRLADFPDTQAHFEAYSEFYFPGLLFLRQRGDRIRFGYESPEGGEVPASCQIIYRYLPNIIYLRKNPEHIIELNPGKNNNNSKLILLIGYTNFNFNKTIVSELNSRIIYDPAVKSSVSIGGNGILGGPNFEFTREVDGETQVDMVSSFQKGNMTIIGYVKDLPKKVTLTISYGRDGDVKFDTHNQIPTEIGLCDDFYNPESKIYFTNLPSKAGLNWNIRALKEQKVNINFYTDSPGTTLIGDLRLSKNSTTNFSIISKENLDCKMSLDFKNGHFVFERNKVDILVNVLLNKTNASLDFSTNISSFCNEPLEIFFGKLFDGNVEVLFSGSYLEISDLNFTFLKPNSNNTKNKDDLTLSNQASSEQLEPLITLKLSSLVLTSRDFIKITRDNVTNNVNLSAGTNGSIKLNDLIIENNIVEIKCGLFEIASDHLYSSAINLSFNLSDIKNTTVESFALENAISKFIIEGFSFKLNLEEILNIDKFRVNFSGSGGLYLTYNNSNINFNGIISGPGLFELENVDFNLSINTTRVMRLKIENFSLSGPTTFFIYAPIELNESGVTNYSFSAGVDTNWHLGKFYLEIVIPIIEIINCNGVGQLSGSLEKCPYGGTFDLVLSIAGAWDWEKIYFVPLSEELERPGLHFGSFSGNISLKVGFPNLKKLGNNHINVIVYSETRLDQFKLEGSNWSISAISLQMQPGSSYISWFNLSDFPNLHFLIDNSDSINLEFDTIIIENKNSGSSFSFKSREVMVPHLEIITETNGDGDGFLYLDTNNQYCNLEITRSNLIKINKTFRAENFNISWNFSGGLFNIINTQGFLEFGAEFEILVFFNGKWRILISINEPTSDFIWSPTQPEINETIQFDGSGSYFSAPITRYDWKWYSTDVWHNNLGAYPTYSYNLNGSYKVTLRVWSGLKHSTCSKIVDIGEPQRNMRILYKNDILLEGNSFDILITEAQNNTPLTGVVVTYAQKDLDGNWQNTTNITNSEGITGFISFDVPESDYINYSDAKICVNDSGCPDAESKWFQVYDNILE